MSPRLALLIHFSSAAELPAAPPFRFFFVNLNSPVVDTGRCQKFRFGSKNLS
jgi:hypothetical protein